MTSSYSPLALLTDLYQLTMAQSLWHSGMTEKEAVFHLFFRKLPFLGGFAIAAGLEAVIEWIKNFRITEKDIEYLASLQNAAHKPLFDSVFLQYLKELKFTGSLYAIPEGTIVFPQEPLIRVEAPLIQAQLLETALLNLVNFPTLIATKAARMCIAAQGEQVVEFGLRRAQGIDGALTASRAAYIGGCSGTSNVLAGQRYGIPVKGTHAHSWVMAFDNELSSFEAYAKAMPDNALFLVDTYDTIQGVEHAIQVAKTLKESGHRFLGIRLDSGDLAYLSIKAREMLDTAGFKDADIVASNELDEYLIAELKRQGAKINVWGIGTNLVTGGTQSALDGVYKLSALREIGKDWEDKIKLSEQLIKVTSPGILQVRRFHENTQYKGDLIYDTRSPLSEKVFGIDPLDATKQLLINPKWKYQDLLEPVFIDGKLVYSMPSIHNIRERTLQEISRIHTGIKRFYNPHVYSVVMEDSLYKKKLNLIKKVRNLKDIGS